MKKLMRVVSMWFVLFILLIPSAVVFAAQDYRVESNLKYKFNKSDEFEKTDYSLQLGYYLKPVDVGNHPLAEAAFLERIGDVTVEGALNALDDDDGSVYDGSSYGLKLRYAMPNQKWTLTGAYWVEKDDYDDSSIIDEGTINQYQIGAGLYLSDGFWAELGYIHNQRELTARTSMISFDDNTQEQFYVSIKWVKELMNSKAINVMGSIGRTEYDDNENDDGTSMLYLLNADYYFTPKLSLGVELGTVHFDNYTTGNDTSDMDVDVYGIRTRWFLCHHFSLMGEYLHTAHRDDSDDDSDSYSISCALRF